MAICHPTTFREPTPLHLDIAHLGRLVSAALKCAGPKAGARVAPIDKLSIVLVAVFGVVFLGERLSGANWGGVALMAAGALLVAYKG